MSSARESAKSREYVGNSASETNTASRTASAIVENGKSRQGRPSNVSQQPHSSKIEEEEGKKEGEEVIMQQRSSSTDDPLSALNGATSLAAFEPTYELHEKATNLRRAIRSCRFNFLGAASNFVSAIAIPVETATRFDLGRIWPLYLRMRSIHDIYGWLEDDSEQSDKNIELEFRRFIGFRAERLEQLADADQQLLLPGYGSISEASEASFYGMEEVVLIDWLNMLARAEWTFQALKEIKSTKSHIIETSAGIGQLNVSVAMYPADLISEYDRESRVKAKELQELEVHLVELRQRMREVGFPIPDDAFNFEIGLLTGKGPARNPLLLPLDHLMTEAYDNGSFLEVETLPQASAKRLANHVNSWLLHVTRRSSLQARLLTLELANYDIPMDEKTASTVLEFWSEDEPTQRLANMPSGIYYIQRGSEVLPDPGSERLDSRATPDFPPASDLSEAPPSNLGLGSWGGVDIFADVDLSTVPVVPRELAHERASTPPSGSLHSSSRAAQTPASKRGNNRTHGQL